MQVLHTEVLDIVYLSYTAYHSYMESVSFVEKQFESFVENFMENMTVKSVNICQSYERMY